MFWGHYSHWARISPDLSRLTSDAGWIWTPTLERQHCQDEFLIQRIPGHGVE